MRFNLIKKFIIIAPLSILTSCFLVGKGEYLGPEEVNSEDIQGCYFSASNLYHYNIEDSLKRCDNVCISDSIIVLIDYDNWGSNDSLISKEQFIIRKNTPFNDGGFVDNFSFFTNDSSKKIIRHSSIEIETLNGEKNIVLGSVLYSNESSKLKEQRCLN